MALADEYAENAAWDRSTDDSDKQRSALRAAIEAALGRGPVPNRAFLERTLAAMEGVIDVADRKTDEFDALRSCVMDLTLMLYSDAPQSQQWVGLTDEDIELVFSAQLATGAVGVQSLARAIEAKLREKNGGGAYSQDTHQPRVNTHQPCNPAEDGVCEALECCDHFPDAGKKVDDTALLRQALHALEYRGTSEWSEWEVRKPVIAALRERLKDVK
jgi:hypothetical protein